MWQLIDKDLEGQSAVTIWRVLRNSTLENAMNKTITMVELKPKTGRFHQLRRHMVSGAVKKGGGRLDADLVYSIRRGFAIVRSLETKHMMEQVQQRTCGTKGCFYAQIK